MNFQRITIGLGVIAALMQTLSVLHPTLEWLYLLAKVMFGFYLGFWIRGALN